MTIFQEASRPGLFPPLVEGMAVMRMGINLECGCRAGRYLQYGGREWVYGCRLPMPVDVLMMRQRGGLRRLKAGMLESSNPDRYGRIGEPCGGQRNSTSPLQCRLGILEKGTWGFRMRTPSFPPRKPEISTASSVLVEASSSALGGSQSPP